MRNLSMPNHITNLLRINGTPEQVTTVREIIGGVCPKDGERPFDFNTVFPMPEGLNVAANRVEVYVAQTDLGVGDAFARQIADRDRDSKSVRPEVLEQLKKNIQKTGYAYWYDWTVEKWGTKWNAYSQKIFEPNLIMFNTAWSCPIPVLEALAAKFPEVEFVIEFADDDIGSNQGTLIFRNGELAERSEAQGDENRRMFAYKVKRLSDEEIKEHEDERAEEKRLEEKSKNVS